jgi:hypothetical protein
MSFPRRGGTSASAPSAKFPESTGSVIGSSW